MKITKRPAAARGKTELGWLHSWHTFSFGEYRDRAHMSFRALRVINDDIVEPGQGFGTHGHQDAEILTYVIEGKLEHKDSMGNGSIIEPGKLQYMSAGTGVTHSEFNPSRSERVHLLQIWILPDGSGGAPRYAEHSLSSATPPNSLTLLFAGKRPGRCDRDPRRRGRLPRQARPRAERSSIARRPRAASGSTCSRAASTSAARSSPRATARRSRTPRRSRSRPQTAPNSCSSTCAERRDPQSPRGSPAASSLAAAGSVSACHAPSGSSIWRTARRLSRGSPATSSTIAARRSSHTRHAGSTVRPKPKSTSTRSSPS